MRIFLAGSSYKKTEQYIYATGAYKLWSPLHNMVNIKRAPKTDKIMIDSGAHSWNKKFINKVGINPSDNLPDAKKYLEDYLRLIYDNRNKKWTFVELDIYGTLYKKYLDDAYKEVKKFGGNFKYIRVYHKILDDGKLTVLKQWIKEGQDYIGLGKENQRQFDKIFYLTRDEIKIHGFAITGLDILLAYPFYSVDSMTWKMCTIFGGHFNGDEMRYHSKERTIKNKDYSMLFDKHEKEILNVDNMVKAQNFYTNLWKKRGVAWN